MCGCGAELDECLCGDRCCPICGCAEAVEAAERLARVAGDRDDQDLCGALVDFEPADL